MLPDDLTVLSDAELAALDKAALAMDGGKDADGWPLPHPDLIKLTAERNRRQRERASREWNKRTQDIQLQSLVSRRRQR